MVGSSHLSVGDPDTTGLTRKPSASTGGFLFQATKLAEKDMGAAADEFPHPLAAPPCLARGRTSSKVTQSVKCEVRRWPGRVESNHCLHGFNVALSRLSYVRSVDRAIPRRMHAQAFAPSGVCDSEPHREKSRESERHQHPERK